MKDEIKDVSNTYEIKTLKEVKLSRKVVNKVLELSPSQREAFFWELLADTTRSIRDNAILVRIKEIKDNIK